MDYYISDSQFDAIDTDAPDKSILFDALTEVADALDQEGIWCHKGNYQLHFWTDDENPKTIFCNAFVLCNPDDANDSSTETYGYYFEILEG